MMMEPNIAARPGMAVFAVRMDAPHEVAAWNGRVASLTGVPVGEAVGRPLGDVLGLEPGNLLARGHRYLPGLGAVQVRSSGRLLICVVTDP